jgi:hypothetical protein
MIGQFCFSGYSGRDPIVLESSCSGNKEVFVAIPRKKQAVAVKQTEQFSREKSRIFLPGEQS